MAAAPREEGLAMAKEIRLNAFEMNTVGHQAPGLWRHPRDRSADYRKLSYWTGLAQTLERGRFDGLFIADVLGIYDVFGGSPDAALRTASQVPVDDPLTHLELTMIHEVMILDHSGPELAAMQFAAALKMTLYAGLIAALLNPFNPLTDPVACVLASTVLMLAVALVVGCVESLTARLPMRWVTRYLLIASAAAMGCMVVIGLGASH